MPNSRARSSANSEATTVPQHGTAHEELQAVVERGKTLLTETFLAGVLKGIASMQPSCECILWRQGAVRCELWSVGELGVLRVFDRTVMTYEESFRKGTWYQRAQELRQRAIVDTRRSSES